jgi:hypothetical protein
VKRVGFIIDTRKSLALGKLVGKGVHWVAAMCFDLGVFNINVFAEFREKLSEITDIWNLIMPFFCAK